MKHRYFVGYIVFEHYLDRKYGDAMEMFGLPKNADVKPAFCNGFYDIKNKITDTSGLNRFTEYLKKKHGNNDVIILGLSYIGEVAE